MKETIDTITQWHKETFPDATLIGQTKKFDEEAEEFETAGVGEKLLELADMVIVSAGVSRFDRNYGSLLCAQTYMIASDAGFDMTELWDAVQKKMEINRQRKWTKKNGLYKHVEE